jgi:hypothetical protein
LRSSHSSRRLTTSSIYVLPGWMTVQMGYKLRRTAQHPEGGRGIYWLTKRIKRASHASRAAPQATRVHVSTIRGLLPAPFFYFSVFPLQTPGCFSRVAISLQWMDPISSCNTAHRREQYFRVFRVIMMRGSGLGGRKFDRNRGVCFLFVSVSRYCMAAGKPEWKIFMQHISAPQALGLLHCTVQGYSGTAEFADRPIQGPSYL